VSDFGETSARHQAHIACPNHRNLQLELLENNNQRNPVGMAFQFSLMPIRVPS
jgi:hypothetical protein